MNLVTDPWMPVTNKMNQLCYISLNQLFERPDEWLDLVLRPHERVSVMRLLICIVQAALDGGPSEDNWNDCIDEIPEKCICYLKKNNGCFNLFDEKRPFLQIAELEPFNKEPTPTTKLNFPLATGNNSTLYDHSCIGVFKDVPVRVLEESDLIISMLSFNNFSLGGLYPQAKWRNKSTIKSGVKDAPCASQSMLHCFVRKKTVVETLHANVLTQEQIEDRFGENCGVPIWENFPSSPDDEDAVKNATRTYIGRLVPLSRWLKVLPDKHTMLMGDGFVYPVYPEFTEPTSVEVASNSNSGDEYKIFGCKTTTPWRELHAISTKRLADKKNIGGPAAIENQPQSENYDLHILALKRNQATILDTVESVLHVPDFFSSSEACRMAYSNGVKSAESVAFKLDKSIQRYLSILMPAMFDVVRKAMDGAKLMKDESSKYQALKVKVKEKYLTHYWTLVEKQRHLLMDYISLIGTERDQERKEANRVWLQAINRAADETYQSLCSQESPRQMRAYVAGWEYLH